MPRTLRPLHMQHPTYATPQDALFFAKITRSSVALVQRTEARLQSAVALARQRRRVVLGDLLVDDHAAVEALLHGL
eukprot:829443-Prymnesium_polylepis.1